MANAVAGAAPQDSGMHSVVPKPWPQGCTQSRAAPCRPIYHETSLRVEEHLHLHLQREGLVSLSLKLQESAWHVP